MKVTLPRYDTLDSCISCECTLSLLALPFSLFQVANLFIYLFLFTKPSLNSNKLAKLRDRVILRAETIHSAFFMALGLWHNFCRISVSSRLHFFITRKFETRVSCEILLNLVSSYLRFLMIYNIKKIAASKFALIGEPLSGTHPTFIDVRTELQRIHKKLKVSGIWEFSDASIPWGSRNRSFVLRRANFPLNRMQGSGTVRSFDKLSWIKFSHV